MIKQKFYENMEKNKKGVSRKLKSLILVNSFVLEKEKRWLIYAVKINIIWCVLLGGAMKWNDEIDLDCKEYLLEAKCEGVGDMIGEVK